MSFEQCALYCAGNTELVKEFNRLSGCHLGERRTPIDIAIDSACGYDYQTERRYHSFWTLSTTASGSLY